jgi:hypothetical protein
MARAKPPDGMSAMPSTRLRTCDIGHAQINTSYSNIPENYNWTLTLVCGEIGHSVGLAHRRSGEPASCMGADLLAALERARSTVINADY